MGEQLHIVMYPWLHLGHIIPYLHFANKLAERSGHKIRTTLLLPKKAVPQLNHMNLHPSLISLHPITIPHVDPLPLGSETASDVPPHLAPHLATAMDLTRPEVESTILGLQPRATLIFYDMAYWVNEIASELGIKTVCYMPVCAACQAMAIAMRPTQDEAVPELAPEYPSTDVVLRGPAEWRKISLRTSQFGSGLKFSERTGRAKTLCDAIGLRTCREIEGAFCDYVSSHFGKPLLLSGPVLPEPNTATPLDPEWAAWLGRFGPGSVVFCTLGSQMTLEREQFQELLLGFEMTKIPFLVVLKPPTGCSSIDEALPEGFQERVGDRGVVHGGWVQQPQILSHPSVGCFVSHCGLGALWESLMSECQIVLLPQAWDHIVNARIMAAQMKVAVEVEKREEDGWVSKESFCKAIKAVMDEESEVGCLVKKNHAKWREVITRQGFMDGYVDNFIKDLERLVTDA